MIEWKKKKSIHYLIRKFINHLMLSGKKEKAEKEEEKSPLKIAEKEIEDSNSNGENVEKSIKSYYFKIAFLF